MRVRSIALVVAAAALMGCFITACDNTAQSCTKQAIEAPEKGGGGGGGGGHGGGSSGGHSSGGSAGHGTSAGEGEGSTGGKTASGGSVTHPFIGGSGASAKC